jgi:hypothetical protein
MGLGRRFARFATAGGGFIGSATCIMSSGLTCHNVNTGTQGMTSLLAKLIQKIDPKNLGNAV